jgi:hypothetical protein
MNNGFRISKEQIGVVLTWLGYVDQARLALQVENSKGHEALCLALQKAVETIQRVIADLPAA